MQYYNFTRLIKKYSSEFTAITLTEGYYDDTGDWVNGSLSAVKLNGAIISHKESKIFRSEGALTEKDKRLFVFQPIDDKLHGAKVIHDDYSGKNVYSIVDNVENSKFTGVFAYTLKYVSAFKDFAPDYDLTEALERLEKRLDGVLVDTEPPKPDSSFSEATTRLEKRLGGVDYD